MFLREVKEKRTLDPDQNADQGTFKNADPDPDPGTQKIRIQCGSGYDTLVLSLKILVIVPGLFSSFHTIPDCS